MRNLAKNKKGASLIEYGILVGLIAVLAIGSVIQLGGSVSDVFSDSSDALAGDAVVVAATGGSAAPFVNPYTDKAETRISIAGIGTRAIASKDTQIDVLYPDAIAEGDLALAFVSHNAALVIPDGWDRVAIAETSAEQGITVLTKAYDAADGSSLSLEQGDALSFLGQVYAIRGGHGLVSSVALASGSSSSTKDHKVPSVYVMQDDTLVIGVLKERFQLTSSETTVEFSAGWTQSTPTRSLNNRLAVAWHSISNAGTQVQGATVNIGHSGAFDWVSMTLQVR